MKVYFIQNIYQAKYSKFIFHRDGNDVVMHGNDGANRKVLASYGQNGLKENSGTAILGGASFNTQLSLISGMIGNSPP